MSYIPILFDETTTNYNNNGIAMLSDTIDYYVVEGRNDIFELTLEYPASGKWASELKDWRQILAKPNEKDDPHVFRITEIVKDLNPSTIYVYATSITNDLGGNLVVELEPKGLNGQEVMNALKANLLSDNRFNFISDIQTRSSTYWYMRNPLNCLVGGEGSFVQYWGGEVKRTNDTIYVYSRRGRDNVTVLRPDKNIEGFTITTSTKSVVTRILPYFSYYSNGENPQEIVTIGDIVASPLANNYPIQRIVPVDFTGDEDIVDKASLMAKANTYFTTLYPDIDKPDVQIEIDMLQLSDSAFYSKFKGLEQINLTDTITVWIEKYNIDMEVKVVELTYNGMSGRTISLVAGSKAASLYETQKGDYSNQINNLQKYISTVENGIINVVQESADGKNRIFRGYTEPSPDISKANDLWFKEIGNGEVEVYTFDGMTWQPMLFSGLGAEIKAEVEEAIRKSEEAKQVAEQSYADSVAEAERLVQVQTDAFNAQMAGVNQEISTVKSNIDTAIANVDTAIANVNQEIANNFTSLSDSISEVDDIAAQAKSDAQTALSNASTAKSDAQTALSNASTALGQAQSAVSTAASANNKAIKSSVVDWALSSSGTTPPTSGWQTSVPTPSSTQYTWGRTTITLNDGTTILSYNVSKIGVKGDKGDTGAGGAKGDKGDAGVNAPKITSVKQQFYLSTSNTTQTGGSWTETIPVWSSGKYYWTRVVTSYDNATTTPSVAVLDNALNQSLVTALEAKSDTQTLSTTVSQHATQIAAKANQTTVDTLTGRVSTAEGSISVQAGQIALKANQTTVDTLTGRVSTAETNISANTTAINLRATKSSVDTLTGRVTTAEGTITAQAGQIALRATTATVNALTGRVSTAEASIVAQSGRIDLAATKTELTTAIDGIEVGGRNLVLNSATDLITSAIGQWGASSLSITNIDGERLKNGDNVTYSVYVEGIPSGESVYARIDFYREDGTYASATNSSVRVSGGQKGRIWVTGKIPTNDTFLTVRARIMPANYSSLYNVQWKHDKLEKGNKATDWTPAPEDVDASIATVQANLTVEAGKITALTSRVSGSETNISNVTQTVSGINTTISTLRTDVNGKATIVALNQVKSTADGNKTTISNHAGRLTTVETNVNGLKTTVADKVSNAQFTVLSNSVSSVVTDLNNLEIGGRNLIVESTLIDGYYLTVSGSSQRHEGWVLTDYISVQPNTDYISSNYYNLGASPSTCFYDANKVYISGLNGSSRYKFTTPSNARFVRVSIDKVGLGQIKLERGNRATDWTPAPEDMAKQSQITQLSTSISTKVESATYNSKMTQLDNAINLRVVQGDVTAAILADKKIKDTRTTNQLPSWYFTNYPSQRVEEFKQRSTMGVPGSATYVKLVTDVPWTGSSGGVVVQTAYSSDGVYNRSGNSAGTAWGGWVKQTDSANVLAQVNLSTEGVLIQGKRIQLDGDVTMTSAFTTRLDTQTLTAITANITSIRSKVLVTDSVTSTHIKAENALIDSIFGTTALITRLTSKTAFINNIKAIEISADKVTTGTLNASNVNIINLNVSKIVGLNSEFIRSNWNANGTDVSITGNGIESTSSNGSYARMIAGEVRSYSSDSKASAILGSGRSQFYIDGTSRAILGRTLHGSAYSGDASLQISYGSEFIIGRYDRESHLSGVKLVPYLTFDYGTQGNEDTGRMRFRKDMDIIAAGVNFRSTTQAIGRIGQISASQNIGIYADSALYLGVNGGNNYASNAIITRTEIKFSVNLNMGGKAITNQSDRRLKTRISPTLVNALAIHRQLNFVDFDWIDESISTERQFGLIAQDSPFIGFMSEDGSWNINSSKQVMLNSLGIKELDETVTRIETFTTQHELEIQLLKDRIKQLEEQIA